MKNAWMLLCVAGVSACTEPVPAQPMGPSLEVVDDGPALPIDHVPVDGIGGGAGGGGGVSEDGGVYQPSASPQRLSVAQLQDSMEVVLGGKTWMVGSTNGFQSRRLTLGQPDFINNTDENLETSALYMKFMSDAARDGCKRAADADAALAAGARVLNRFSGLTDTVSTNAAGIDANLRYLKLRFHGVKVAEGDAASIAGLRGLFTAAVSGAAGTGAVDAADVKEGWRAVCVALLTAPEYHLY